MVLLNLDTGRLLQAIDPCFPPPNAEAAATIEALSSFDVLIDTPSGRNMRRTISGSGRGAYNSTIAAAARSIRKTNSNKSNAESVAATAVGRTNSSSSSSAAVGTPSGSGSGDEDNSVVVDRSLQRTNRTNADDSKAVSNAAPVEGADLMKTGSSLTNQLLKTASANAASVYQQNLVIRTMRKTNSGLGANKAAFRV